LIFNYEQYFYPFLDLNPIFLLGFFRVLRTIRVKILIKGIDLKNIPPEKDKKIIKNVHFLLSKIWYNFDKVFISKFYIF